MNIRVNTRGRVQEVIIKSNHEPTFLRERLYPYSVAGDEVQYGGEYFPMNLSIDTYIFEAIPVDSTGARNDYKKIEIQFIE
ncbi:MAG: hypothetical protein ACPGN3_02000 [Opitutales bacterium]